MTRDEIRRHELSSFLRIRRGRIDPADLGTCPRHSGAEHPACAREEVAQVGRDERDPWYTWLEQKRPIGVSSGVLDNLARVLRLDPAERLL